MVPRREKRRGQAVMLAGVLGMLVWFNQPETLLNVSKITEWVLFLLFITVVIGLGLATERVTRRNE